MTRTVGPDEAPPRSKKSDRGRGPRSTQSRTVIISKALSRLLRHQAVNEGVPITSDGWVRLDHLLAWKGLSSRNGVNPQPTIEEIWEVVEDNEKKRFAVRRTGKVPTNANAEGSIITDIQHQPTTTVDELVESNDHAIQQAESNSATHGSKQILPFSTKDANSVADKAKTLGFTQNGPPLSHASASSHRESSSIEAQADSQTSQTISYYRNTHPSPSASDFQIRAVQGHSIQTVASDTSLLTPITLDKSESIPETCVHGTFYGSWPLILRSGGLRRMGRNHVHFASGPSPAEIGVTREGDVTQGKSDKVISGMRNDAQLLIYVDVKKCLEDIQEQGTEMLWWKSENGVILTEGVESSESQHTRTDNGAGHTIGAEKEAISADTEGQHAVPSKDTVEESHISEAAQKVTEVRAKGKEGLGGRFKTAHSKKAQAEAQADKVVPMKYWTLVVDVKQGHGVIWRAGEGIVKELPEALTSKGTPKGFRGRGGAGGGGRGRGR